MISRKLTLDCGGDDPPLDFGSAARLCKNVGKTPMFGLIKNRPHRTAYKRRLRSQKWFWHSQIFRISASFCVFTQLQRKPT
jgi:hypothetical protein